jgi:hypothetical protein
MTACLVAFTSEAAECNFQGLLKTMETNIQITLSNKHEAFKLFPVEHLFTYCSFLHLTFYAGSCKDIHDNNPSAVSGEYFLITVTGRKLEKVRTCFYCVCNARCDDDSVGE